jgi:SAM-dependent methyltransferase
MAPVEASLGRKDELTFRANLRGARYGWLRLTPAYSVHLVAALLDKHAAPGARVLDPFCGTGTTALVCAERGLACDTTDINPFLVWLARAKTRRYGAADVAAFRAVAARVTAAMRRPRGTAWVPPIHKIERWWSVSGLAALGRGREAILRARPESPARAADLLDLAFCRAMIESAHVSFGHQSMSFRKGAVPEGAHADDVARRFAAAVDAIGSAAASPVRRVPLARLADARDLGAKLSPGAYDNVITSPPYPNRMSYVRELRPYMYWLGYLERARDAGELDWRAIGGTWGCATSNVAKWSAPKETPPVPFLRFEEILSAIGERSEVLARYVAKYFHDTVLHARSLFPLVAPGGSVHYIVGNSKFFEVVLPVEAIFAAIFESVGFERIRAETIRKRSSKKELYEFVVSAEKGSAERGSAERGRGPAT